MSRMISLAYRLNKPTISPLIFDCYIDTIIIYFRTSRMPPEDWKLLRTIYGATPHHYRNGKIGYMLVGFQCPQPELLRELARLAREHGGMIYRLDIGCDVRIDEDYTVEEQQRFLKEHMLLIRRKSQRIEERPNEDGTTGCYYCPHAHINGAPRDICLYWGLSSKLDPLSEICAHFDLRLRDRPVRPIKLDGLEHLDPSKILLRHIRFVEFGRQQFERKLFKEKTKGMGLEEAKALIAHMRRHDQLDYVQRARDQHDVPLRTNNDLVTLPSALAWRAVRRKAKEEAIGREINELGDTFAI